MQYFENDRMLTIPEGDDQKKTVLKKQDERRRHGIEGLLNRVIAYVRLVYSGGFQPPCNFTPESRATPTKGRGFPMEIRAGVRRNNADVQTADAEIPRTRNFRSHFLPSEQISSLLSYGKHEIMISI